MGSTLNFTVLINSYQQSTCGPYSVTVYIISEHMGRYISVGAHTVTVEKPPAQECKNVHRYTCIATLTVKNSCKQSHIYVLVCTKKLCKDFTLTIYNDAVMLYFSAMRYN